MHELSIAKRIADIVAEEAIKSGMSRVSLAHLKIGKMSAFQKEQLEFYLLSREKSEVLNGMRFEIEEAPVELLCKVCGKKFTDNRFDDEEYAHSVAHAPSLYMPPNCPSCQGTDVLISSGNEMELVSIEGE